MTGPEMVAWAKALGPVIVCEDNGHTYPATLTAAGDAEIRGVA